MPDFSIVIPCYNEASNLRAVLDGFAEFMCNCNAELILVNNGSTDETEAMREEVILNFPFVRWVKVDKNLGYGHGIMQGLLAAKGKYLAYTHADLQTDPYDVFRAIHFLMEEKPDLVFIKGNRLGRNFVARFFSWSMQLVIQFILKVKLEEINAQPTLFSKELMESLKQAPVHWGFDLFVYYRAVQLNYQVKRFDVNFPERRAGESKWNRGFASRINLSIKMMKYCFELKRYHKTENP